MKRIVFVVLPALLVLTLALTCWSQQTKTPPKPSTRSATPTTSPTGSQLVGGQYISAGATLTDGQQCAFQMDSTGHVLTTGGSVTFPAAGAAVSPVFGVLQDGAGNAQTISTAIINTAVSGNTLLVAGVSGKKVRVLAYRLQTAGAVNVKFQDTTPADLSMLWTLGSSTTSGVVVNAPTGSYEFATTANLGLNVNLSGTVQVYGQVQYLQY